MGEDHAAQSAVQSVSDKPTLGSRIIASLDHPGFLGVTISTTSRLTSQRPHAPTSTCCMVNRVVQRAELRAASLKYAKRLSLTSPEALYATKRAVNGVADVAGFRAGLYAGLDIVGPLYATMTELDARFCEIATTEGVPAAVRWRSAQFRE
jgi:hypothetical protein